MKMRPISGWVRMTILFTIAGFFEVAAYGQVSAFTPLYLPHLGIEAATVAFWVGAITSFSNFAGLPFLPFWGALADRYGRKPLIIRSFVAAFVALSLTALAPNVWVFALARAIQSLGLGNTGLILATLAEHAPAGRIAFAFGIVNGANPMGAFIGPLVGGPIVDGLGFPVLMAADAAIMLGVGAVLAAIWITPFFARDIVPFTVLWTVVNGLAAALFSVSFTLLSASATDATRGRVMTFAYLPANIGFVIGPGIGSIIASVDVFLVFPAAAVLTALGLAAVIFAWRQPLPAEISQLTDA